MLKDIINKIQAPDAEAQKVCRDRLNAIAKPLHSLGKFEELLIEIAGIQRSPQIHIGKKALTVWCADNGVVAEGVTQTGQEVTAIVAENFTKEYATCTGTLCRQYGVDVFPVDIGMARDVAAVENRKIACGTKNFAKEPAMTREEAEAAVLTGAKKALELIDAGYEILSIGEMGIGNTTTSSALVSVFLGLSPEIVTGRGAGLSSEGLERKIRVIRDAIEFHKPDPKDPLDVLSKVGGFDIAGMAGVILGAASAQTPVVIDGFISAAASLLAVRLAPACRDYILASHGSAEPAAILALEALGKTAPIQGGMFLGEGSGAVMLFPLLDGVTEIYHQMSTFSDIEIDAYEELK